MNAPDGICLEKQRKLPSFHIKIHMFFLLLFGLFSGMIEKTQESLEMRKLNLPMTALFGGKATVFYSPNTKG